MNYSYSKRKELLNVLNHKNLDIFTYFKMKTSSIFHLDTDNYFSVKDLISFSEYSILMISPLFFFLFPENTKFNSPVHL